MDVNLHLKVNEQASSDDLVWFAEQMERWADDLLDRFGWNCVIEAEPMSDLKNGEIPKSGSLRATGDIEFLERCARILGTTPPSIPEHIREQYEAVQESISPRGSVLVVLQVSDEDFTSADSVAIDAADALQARLDERPHTAEILPI